MVVNIDTCVFTDRVSYFGCYQINIKRLETENFGCYQINIKRLETERKQLCNIHIYKQKLHFNKNEILDISCMTESVWKAM